MPKGNRRLISADSHFTEPGDLFTKRVPAKFRDRAPRIESFPQGDGWVIEGMSEPRNFGWNNCAGLPADKMTGWCRFDDIRKGGYIPAERIKEQDIDGVSAEVMYPTPSVSAGITSNDDAEFHLACVRAYNDWVSEYVAYAPDRFAGLGLLPCKNGPKAAVEEMNRVLDRPGMRGMILTTYANGTLAIKPEDDIVWAAHAERGIPVNIHVALSQAKPSPHKAKLPGYGRFFDAPNRMIEMIFAGVFDRYPKLEVVFAEVDFGWVPYVKEQIDNNYQRLDAVSDFGLKRMPSDYVDQHFHFGYMTDTVGLHMLHMMNPERVLWSTDYPHISADYPNSWRTIQASMCGIAPKSRDLICHGNAERLYRFKPTTAAAGVETPTARAAA